jgi:hypothetical protein
MRSFDAPPQGHQNNHREAARHRLKALWEYWGYDLEDEGYGA